MKRLLSSIATATLALSTVAPAFAAQTVPIRYESATITLNTKIMSHPDRFTYNNTTYMPIWYVQQVLTRMGVKNAWNGVSHTWNLSAKGNVTGNVIDAKSGLTSVIVNGHEMETHVPTLVKGDPLHKDAATTYMPIWYVQQVLNRVGTQADVWNGTVGVWVLGSLSTLLSGVSNTSSTSSAGLTQAQMVQDLIAAYQQIPSWPAQLTVTKEGAPYATTKFPPSQKAWVGLHCVFPTAAISQYPTLLGMTESNPNGLVTAAQVAQWMVNWAVKARHINMAVSVSTNPFTWAQTFSLFWGTNLMSPTSIVTAADAKRIEQNVIDVSRGWRMINSHTISFLSPLMDLGSQQRNGWGVGGTIANALQSMSIATKHPVTWADWPAIYSHIVQLQDTTQVTLEPYGVLYSRQPSSGWAVESSFYFFGANRKQIGGWRGATSSPSDKYTSLQESYPIAIKNNAYGAGQGYFPLDRGYPTVSGDQSFMYNSALASKLTLGYNAYLMPTPNQYVTYKGTSIVGVTAGAYQWNGGSYAAMNWDYPLQLQNIT
ncbi:MAG: hypothetical protein ACYCYO_00175 [Bacilli bacterium]